MITDINLYLTPTYFLDSDHAGVIDYAKRHSSPEASAKENVVRLYNAVRDDFTYNPYKLDLRSEGLKASDILSRDYGHCVSKASLLAACARVIGVPSRLAFFNVKNHIATEKIESFLKTNVLVFHGCTELWLEGRWVKATPAFNTALCRKLNVETLDFDGENDSVFQQYDRTGKVFMDYVHEYGSFHELPYDLMIGQLRKHYRSILSDEMLAKAGMVLDLNLLAHAE